MSVFRNPSLLIVSFGHFATDFYASFMPLVWPLLTVPLGLTYGMVGAVSTIFMVTSSLTQPFFGYFGDRYSSRLLAALGLGTAAACMGLLGFVDSYAALVLVVGMIGLGAGAFHPQGAMNAAIAAGRNKATGMSIFSMGGTGAYAVGPLAASLLLTTALGLKVTTLLAIPGLLAAVWLYQAMQAIERRKEATAGARADAPNARLQFLALAALVVVVGLRAWAYTATTTYLPLLFQEHQLPITFSGQVLFLMQSGGVAGLLAGGYMADRFGRRRVVAASLLLLGPAAVVLYNSPAEMVPLAAILFGFVGDVPMPITTVMGQELLPRHVGVASGLVMGLAFVTGGAGVAVTGLLADAFDLSAALSVLPIMPILAAGLCLLLPSTHTPSQATAEGSAHA